MPEKQKSTPCKVAYETSKILVLLRKSAVLTQNLVLQLQTRYVLSNLLASLPPSVEMVVTFPPWERLTKQNEAGFEGFFTFIFG